MPQFIVAQADLDLSRSRAQLVGAEARHCAAVLRLRPGDPILVSDGVGRRWQGVCTATGAGRVEVEQLQPLEANEPELQLELLQGLPKGERWEDLLEKGTELGIRVFRPLYTAHSVPHLGPAQVEKRLVRWRQKLQAAVKQCERSRVPLIYEPEHLEYVLPQLGPTGDRELRLVLTERNVGHPWPAGDGIERVRLAVGPEGGWAPSEYALFQAAGFCPISLGPRVLRTDTAALAGSALIMQRWGDLVSGGARW